MGTDPYDLTTRPASPDRGEATWSVVVIDDQALRSHAIPTTGTCVIGRTREADLPLEHASISRRHASLQITDGALELEDHGSANGTRVGGRRLAAHERLRLAVGDSIELGEVLLVVQRTVASAPRVAPRIVIDDVAMQQLHRIVDRVAVGGISVLLLGETGVGKEVMARTIHDRSPRAAAPFVSINCAALSESLLESELFGHEKGAFTGADRTKPGLLETADGGTLLLDEVGEMPLAIQAKLLRALEQRQVVRVGAVTPRAVDVRFISATNRDLPREIAAGAFRSDLYFRINGISLVIPPLRDRRSEIITLARTFIATASKALGRTPEPRLGDRAIAHLLAHRWPGNIRELRNAMERAVLLADDVIEPEHVPLDAPPTATPTTTVPADAGPSLHRAVEQVERERIVAALERCNGNQSRAAIELGISRGTLTARLKIYGIVPTRSRT